MQGLDGSVTVLREVGSCRFGSYPRTRRRLRWRTRRRVRGRVDRVKAEQLSQPTYKPGTGPSLAPVVQVGREWGRRWMRKIGDDAAPGIGLRSLRSLSPNARGSTPRGVRTSDVHGQRTDQKGHFNLDKRGHFNFWFDMTVLPLAHSSAPVYTFLSGVTELKGEHQWIFGRT